MNLIALAPTWLLVTFVLLLFLAAAQDAWRLKISNVTCLAMVVTAIAAALLHGLEIPLWQNLVVFGLILVLGTLLFGAGLLGGGDVKLFAAAGLWFDFRSAIWFVACVFVAGGVLGLAYLLARVLRRGRLRKESSTRVPYGIAIAAGGIFLIVMWDGWIGPHHGNALDNLHPIEGAAHAFSFP